ncbi:MAG: DNA mismatch repair endonuclease MutL [Deltaproteobacteria bacterium]|nr:DNA mismatch repair endonuclease MutL [Deltaproteobacteria bacterium]
MIENRIKALPDTLINQIAAGEVIESPASVVKELMENAVDAGATRMRIEIENGGASLIRVIDNGCGMNPADAALAITRHATSKISSIEDLQSIRTMGFRGEALPSIASVSRFTIETRPPDSDIGTRIVVDGKPLEAEPCACPTGTAVTVRDLFYNVPARLKFLKGERSLKAAVRSLVVKTALAFPHLQLTFRSGPRGESVYPSCDRLIDRAAMMLGKGVIGHLYEFSGERDGVRVSGVLGDPDLARPDPSRIFILVNARPITDLVIRRAVLQAYSVLIPSGRYPVVVVGIEIDPAEVDVNVHPRKTEVRFRRQRDIAGVVFGAIQDTVTKTPWIRVSPGGDDVPPSTIADVDHWSQSSGPAWNPGARDVHAGADNPGSGNLELFGRPVHDGRVVFADLKYVGQVANTVLVCEGHDSLILIDQHAAHERVNYDRLWRDLEAGAVAREPLMFPEVIHLSPGEVSLLEPAREELLKMGFDIETYSGDSVAIRTAPAILNGRSAARAVRDCLSALMSDEAELDGGARLRKVVSTVACHASVTAGDQLSGEEVRALLRSMDGIDLAAYCPHGRQSVVVYSMGTVLRWFGR